MKKITQGNLNLKKNKHLWITYLYCSVLGTAALFPRIISVLFSAGILLLHSVSSRC